MLPGIRVKGQMVVSTQRQMLIIASLIIVLLGSGCIPGRFKFKIHKKSIDSEQPTLELSSNYTSPTNKSPIPVSATFSESVTGFSLASITVTNGNASNLQGAGNYYTFDVTPIAQGSIRVEVAAGAATDANGHFNIASQSLTWIYDSIVPILNFNSISHSSPSWTTLTPSISVTLSEASTVTLYKDSSCTGDPVSKTKSLEGAAGQSITSNPVGYASKTNFYAQAVDAAGNASTCKSMASYTRLKRFEDPNPSTGNGFGDTVVELTNGNIVITASSATINGVANAGAVYL